MLPARTDGAAFVNPYTRRPETSTSARGVAPETARARVARTPHAPGTTAAGHPERVLTEMVRTLATPGGITDAGLEAPRERGGLAARVGACAALRDRLR